MRGAGPRRRRPAARTRRRLPARRRPRRRRPARPRRPPPRRRPRARSGGRRARCVGLWNPGVSVNTTCTSSVVQIARMSRRVVCGLSETIATFSPTSAFTRVDLPDVGAADHRHDAGPVTGVRLRSPAGAVEVARAERVGQQLVERPVVRDDPSADSAITAMPGPPNSNSTWRQPPHGGVGSSASVTTATARTPVPRRPPPPSPRRCARRRPRPGSSRSRRSPPRRPGRRRAARPRRGTRCKGRTRSSRTPRAVATSSSTTSGSIEVTGPAPPRGSPRPRGRA